MGTPEIGYIFTMSFEAEIPDEEVFSSQAKFLQKRKGIEIPEDIDEPLGIFCESFIKDVKEKVDSSSGLIYEGQTYGYCPNGGFMCRIKWYTEQENDKESRCLELQGIMDEVLSELRKCFEISITKAMIHAQPVFPITGKWLKPSILGGE